MLPSEYLAKGWCQDTTAIDRHRNLTDYRGSDAVAWCFVGAIGAATGDSFHPIRTIACELVGMEIAKWRDWPSSSWGCVAWKIWPCPPKNLCLSSADKFA